MTRVVRGEEEVGATRSEQLIVEGHLDSEILLSEMETGPPHREAESLCEMDLFLLYLELVHAHHLFRLALDLIPWLEQVGLYLQHLESVEIEAELLLDFLHALLTVT